MIKLFNVFRRKYAKFFALIVLASIVIAGMVYGKAAYMAAPLSATVVDGSTGAPIQGVNVVASWVRKGGLEGGNVSGHLMVMESVTDKSGQFHFSGWGPRIGLPLGEIQAGAPEIWIFKSGYRYQRIANEYWSIAPFYMRSIHDGTVIYLEPFKDDFEAYAQVTSQLDTDINALLDNDECNWRSIPKFLWAVEQENKVLVSKKTTYHLRPLAYVSERYSRRCGDLGTYVERYGK